MISNDMQNVFLHMAEVQYNNSADKTMDGLKAAADSTRTAMSVMATIDDDAFANLLAQLQEMITVEMNFDGGVITGEKDYYHWLSADKANIEWNFWNAYKRYLEEEKHWPSQVVQSLDEAGDAIVDLAGDPRQEEGFLRKGLVIGDVQSGKTATYTAVLNKAVDAGYKVCIVLAGMQEDLRRQTQSRLDAEFVGYRSSEASCNSAQGYRREKIGVGFKKASSKYYAVQNTSTIRDFNASNAEKNSAYLKDIKVPVLFVVKKQKNILTNLAIWLEKLVDEHTNKIMQPMLLIDDEADNASINTNSEEDSPTAINKGIRRILDIFYKAAYIGFTATPFANIFIQPDVEDENQSDEMEAARFSKADLFPSNFIYALDTPSNYIGAVKIFGSESSCGDEKAPHEYMLKEINTDEMEQIIPYKHKKELEIHKLPSDLEKALYYFLLINAVRDCRAATKIEYRPDKKSHRSMMIHVSRFTAVQSRIYNLVNDWLYKVKSEIQNYAALPKTAVKDNKILNDMERIYTEMLAENVKIDWDKIRRKYLHKAVAGIEMRLQNSAKRTGNSRVLDYEGYKDGLRVIAVGGNSFSRGLTLEGLCVTFFYRRSLMYDTLMQMGRWFGYRPWCADLCRIWLAPDAIGWYRYITNAIEELKDQIRYMQSQDLTPSEFGLMVRRHPASLIVTAKNKMRSAETIRRAVTISGRYLEAPNLLDDTDALEQNYKQFVNFIKRMPHVHTAQDVFHTDAFWRGVSGEVVAGLVASFKSSHWSLDFQGDALYRYIIRNLSEDIWDVVIAGGESNRMEAINTDYGKISIKPICRTITKCNDIIQIGGSRARIETLDICKNGLTKQQIEAVRKEFYNVETKKQRHPYAKSYMIKNRQPLLVLFFIEPTRDTKNPVDLDTLPPILCTLGLGFPSTGEEEKTTLYAANPTAVRNEVNDIYGNGD